MGSDDVVEFLLEKGADVTIQGGECGSALAAASVALSSDLETVQLLLNHGADINATTTGGGIGNAVNAATHRKHTKLLGLLLDSGADIDAQGGTYGTALQRACADGSLEMVRMLLTRGANVNAQGGKYGTALQAVCAHAFKYNSPTITIFNLLLEYGADVHTQGGFFGSTWHAAAVQENSEILSALQQLLDRGVDVNDSRGTQHPTALQAALAFENRIYHSAAIDRIRFLLDRGADANLTAGIYGFQLQSACAIKFGGYGAAFLLENCGGLDVNTQGGLFGSALQAAAWAGQMDSVKLLLRKGANVNARGGKYGSALNAAVVQGYWDIVEVLLDNEAKPDCFFLQDTDKAWLSLIQEECGQGAIERYRVFWEKQKLLLERQMSPLEHRNYLDETWCSQEYV
ncbi:ankyrin repeat-containing domain protein [Trichoderma compactum]